MPMNKKFNIPKEIVNITETLENRGFEAYLVGGCVRDLIRKAVYGELVEPKDWDITTNATPEQIIELFPKTVYENKFGTVVVIAETSAETLRQVEVTPYRIEAKYSDNRHPDAVKFSNHLEDDLRLIRAIRFSAQLGFAVSQETMEAIIRNAKLLKNISQERIRDEFSKIIMTSEPMSGIAMLEKTGLLDYLIPELKEGIKVEQKGEHIYDVWEHLLRALQHSADKDWPLQIRLSALFHDIGKPKTRRAGAK